MKEQAKPVKTLVTYALLSLLTLMTAAIMMQLWRADLRVPFIYSGDANMSAEWVKALIENGWFLDNRYTGMPDGTNLRDVPMSDNLHYAIIKVISLFTNDYAATMNLFYLLTFPLIVCTAYYVFRKFSITPFLSFMGAFLFSFMEYHYFRNIQHIFQTAYYMNPLVIMILLWMLAGSLDTMKQENRSGGAAGSFNSKFLGSVAICFITAACGIYYAYFSCFFLVLTGGIRAIWQKNIKPLGIAAVLVATIMIGGILNLAPVILYQIQKGPDPAASARVYHEAELYSLKITDLLLPATNHRIKFLSDLKAKHERETSFLYRFYEPKTGASLGVIAGMGFVFLLAFLILYRKSDRNDAAGNNTLLYHLSILNIGALLLATTGGFSSLVSHFIRYKIRAYERLSIFIAFFALFAVLILIQKLYDSYIRNPRGPRIRIGSYDLHASRVAYYFSLIVLLAAGLYDQAGDRSIPDYDTVKKNFIQDEQFVRRMEGALPPDSMVFQLPYVSYPETRFPFKMIDYDHFRCYLHSKTLRWSYGAVKGRESDAWQKSIVSKPAALFLKEIHDRGFRGLYIDRNGYEDNGEKIVREIQGLVKTAPITSDDGTRVFFRLDRPSGT